MTATRSIAVRAGGFVALAVFVLLAALVPRAAAEEVALPEAAPSPMESTAPPVAEAAAPPAVEAPVVPVEATPPPAPQVSTVAQEASATAAVPPSEPVVEQVTDKVEETSSSATAEAPASPAKLISAGDRPSTRPVAAVPPVPVEVDRAGSAGALHDVAAEVSNVVADDDPTSASERVAKTIGSVGDTVGGAVGSATSGTASTETLRRHADAIGEALAPVVGPAPSAAVGKLLSVVGGVVPAIVPGPLPGILPPAPTATESLSAIAPDPASIEPPRSTVDVPAPTVTADADAESLELPKATSPGRPAIAPSPLGLGREVGRGTLARGDSIVGTTTTTAATSALSSPRSADPMTQPPVRRADPAGGPTGPAPLAPAAPGTTTAPGGGSGSNLFFPLSALAVLVALSAPAGLRRSRELLERCSAAPFVCALERPG